MREWLRGGFAAARLAADRADLWFPGALVSFAFAGWVVLLVVVAAPPDQGDALSFGIRLAASPWWPWNAVALIVAVASGIGTLLLAIAFGEVALLTGFADGERHDVTVTVPRTMGVLGLAAVPIAVLGAILLWLAAPAFVDAYAQPDPATPYLVRVLAVAWPALVALAACAALAQAFGALTLRLPWLVAWRTLRRRWPWVIPQAALTMGAFVIGQLLTVVTLGSLWRPLSGRLADGRLFETPTVILLLGFVWIWLVLVVLAGVVQAWISAWWNETLAPARGRLNRMPDTEDRS